MSQDARRDEELAAARRASILGLTYIDTSIIADKQLYNDLLPKEDLYSLKVIPIKSDSHNITFGVTNTTSQQTMTQLKQRFADQQVIYGLISDAGYREYMRLYDPPPKIEYSDIELTSNGTKSLVNQVSATLEQIKADDMLAYLVQQAYRLSASDIHVETGRDADRIRYRIDGVLHPIAQLTHERTHMLISAIASAGNISTSNNEAQQGHISQNVRMATGNNVDVNLRVETVPAINGMDVVMRLFNFDASMFTLDRLGLSDRERSVVEDIIRKPSGLVLVIGPTGSGKTTTLYSILNSLKSDERKIITIEDPVEYQFDGITQISVNTKSSSELSFAEKLRAVLRLDPDVVMVGEIRDMDTAKTALQASLTGHLVLSTFHAGSAAAAITRLMDVIGENPLFASAIRLVMAQRLVRRLDDKAKLTYQPDEQNLKFIQKVVESLPSGVERPNLNGLQLYKAGGSTENPYGYKGQIAIREQFTMSDKIIELLREQGRQVSTDEINKAAGDSGMLTMLQDAVLKVIAGHTTMEEIFRVVG